ncbi:hypothetical protein IW261DRAFT_1428825 [Armillaria novae-zelandiae]|uniref:Uncharacterized protein n=1 Tax=Armillaria novae-zelandiae TaxID=153914 RepID=A0AA39N856_9AGAR|nr:hypothetical protein IW261DRAFT_1428825 [Armillaria novae-zelandiae]
MLQFLSECLLIIFIAYPILCFLIETHPRLVHLTPILLLGLTVASTVVISAILNLILWLWGETEGGEEEELCCREKGEVLYSEDKSIPSYPRTLSSLRGVFADGKNCSSKKLVYGKFS